MPLSQMVPGVLRPVAGRVKRSLLRLQPVRMSKPLDPEGCRGSLELLKPVAVVDQGMLVECPIRLRNHSSTPWSSRGRYPVVLSVTWLNSRKQPIEQPASRIELPCVVRPGEEVIAPVRIPVVDALGHYLLRVELRQEPAIHFDDSGTPAAFLDCQVTAPPTTDIDYHKAYSTADLNRDYWTVVGPSTKAEFDRLGDVKLKHLIDLGLTPDSRLLDVGCGTGLLTVAAEKYLSDQGFYFGTDVGPEAIAHCRKIYTRPNFRFDVNDMTTLPIGSDHKFDAACFYSVFTHTFPDETALLLAETKRVLAPGGWIFADVFTSTMVERCAGNRGALEVNPEHFMRLVDLVGLKAELVMSAPWQRFSERRFYKFTSRK